ncbi:hypothetical protein DF182_01355 [Chitinophaga flava]|uniref:Uncharacterized protein n=1 Tax=Chitinophaga flava TaxID=2259036 RepID=A0A365XY40_9BACT|nr:hypothetical protein DF182_01355 [Chitinophaga flava]
MFTLTSRKAYGKRLPIYQYYQGKPVKSRSGRCFIYLLKSFTVLIFEAWARCLLMRKSNTS